MTELSFLIELLLNHDLPKETKDLIASRIKEVEEKLCYVTNPTKPAWQPVPYVTGPQQSPSTLAAMARHGMVPPPVMPPVETPVPVEQIAQTPATIVALNSRNQAIADSIAGKTDKLTGRPRKF